MNGSTPDNRANAAMLKLENVTKTFGSYTAIDDLSLQIPEGSIFGLLGPNGAGKTTLLRMVMGLIAPTSGHITLFGAVRLKKRDVRQRIGYMPQQMAIYPGLSVLENILFFGRLYQISEKKLQQKAGEIIDLVDLKQKKDALVATLSGGMIRRAMLATTLIHQPSLLILDEPTAGVDPALRLRFWAWFQTLASEQGISILITTHHIAEASRCDQVIFLRQGKLLEQGSPDNLMQKYGAVDLEQAFVKATEEIHSLEGV